MSQEALKKYTPKQKLRVVGNYYTVYEAIQVGLDRSVELRVLNYKADPGTPEYQRFALECKTLAKLDHPHILKVLDIGMAMDHIFYVTDYREAKSLQELMDAGVEWSAREVIEHARSLASALKHIHRHQVLHRDLSLHSIKIADETGAAYISEFSLVKNLNLVNLTLAGVERLVQLQWTPEDIQGQPPTPRTDIFLLGWVLYRMLTYRKPAAQRLTDPSANDVAEEMFHPRTADPTIPEELDAIVRRCLQADPDQRYPDAPSLTKDLDAAQDKLTMKRVLAQMAEVSAAKPPSGAVAKPGAPRAAEPALRATRRFEVVLDATAQQTAPEAAAPAASTSASAASISASSLSGATPAPAATAAATPGFSTSTSSSSPIAIDRTTRQTARTTRLSTALEVPKRDRSLTVMVGGTALEGVHPCGGR
jgi:serine/threonine protein kinase